MVSAWATDLGLPLVQVATDAQSYEIAAIPELSKLVDFKGTVIKIDAMGTQAAIATQIVDGEADYVLALKGNQGALQQTVLAYIKQADGAWTRGDSTVHSNARIE